MIGNAGKAKIGGMLLAAAAVTGAVSCIGVGTASAEPSAVAADWDGCEGMVDAVSLSNDAALNGGYSSSWDIKTSRNDNSGHDCYFQITAGFLDAGRSDRGMTNVISYTSQGGLDNNSNYFYSSQDESRPKFVSIAACDSTGCSDAVTTQSTWPTDH